MGRLASCCINRFHLFPIDFHWFSIPNPLQNLQNHWKSFKICAKSCKRGIKTHNVHQIWHLIHHGCEKSRFGIDFYWFSLNFTWIFIDCHWFSTPKPPKICANPCKMIKKCITFIKIDIWYTLYAKKYFLYRFYYFLLVFIDFHWCSLIFTDFHWFSIFVCVHWFSLMCIDFHWLFMEFHWFSSQDRVFRMLRG